MYVYLCVYVLPHVDLIMCHVCTFGIEKKFIVCFIVLKYVLCEFLFTYLISILIKKPSNQRADVRTNRKIKSISLDQQFVGPINVHRTNGSSDQRTSRWTNGINCRINEQSDHWAVGPTGRRAKRCPLLFWIGRIFYLSETEYFHLK